MTFLLAYVTVIVFRVFKDCASCILVYDPVAEFYVFWILTIPYVALFLVIAS